MGQVLACCFSNEDERNEETHKLVETKSTYIAPDMYPQQKQILQVVPCRKDQVVAVDESIQKSSLRNVPPPPFFKRLDEFIKKNGLKSHDVFTVMDQNKNKQITALELKEGLLYIGFHLSSVEKDALSLWMTDHHVSWIKFKEFALALKQRESIQTE